MNIIYFKKNKPKWFNLVLDKFVKDKQIEEKVIIKLLRGDIFGEIVDESAEALEGIYKIVQNEEFIPNDLDGIQEDLDLMHDVLLLIDLYALDENGSEVDGFEALVTLVRDMMNKAVNQMNTLNTSEEPIDANNTLAI